MRTDEPATPRPTEPATSYQHPATYGEDLISVLIGLWLTVGGFLDGYAHRNLDTPETFFTPWHGVLYSAYVAAVVWISWTAGRHRPKVSSLSDAIPVAYGTSVAGLVVFGLGGAGDLVWHTILGIEAGIEALLSPTHLLLLVGALLYLSGPLRSCWRHSPTAPGSLAAFWPPLLALSLAAAEIGFFFQYADGFFTRFMEAPYDAATGQGTLQLALGVTSMLITTVILMGALLLMVRRWHPPIGAGLVMLSLYGLLMGGLSGYEFPEDLIPPVVGGVAADALIRLVDRGPRQLAGIRWLAFFVPVSMFGARMAVFTISSEIGWRAPAWTGAILLAGLAGVATSLLVFPAGSTNEPAHAPPRAG